MRSLSRAAAAEEYTDHANIRKKNIFIHGTTKFDVRLY